MYAERLALQGCRDVVDVDISWHGPAHALMDVPASEATVQALSGVMHVHGRDRSRPRRMGIELGCVIAGHLATQAALAARIAQRRHGRALCVATSVLQADLLVLSHHIATATGGGGPEPVDNGGPGPPFRSADGAWIEIETLDAGAWRSFWTALGAAGAYLEPSWRSFRRRFGTATCSLAPQLHAATAARTLAELTAVAAAHEVSLTPLRRCTDALSDPGLAVVGPVLRRADGRRAVQQPARRRRPEASLDADVLGPDPSLPLAGIRVVEATNRIQGPLAGLLLQMLGAAVVRVEPLAGNVSVIDTTLNRGKRHVALQLSTAAGRSDLLDLVAEADVFLHNWRPGKAAEWTLDSPDLFAVNPRLIYAAASAWADCRGPSKLVGTDFMVQAFTGLGDTINPLGDPPVPTRLPVSDVMGAVLTAEGVLAALDEREVNGGPRRVDSSLLGGAMALQAHVLNALASGAEDGRRAGRPLWGPLDLPLETEEGFLVVDAADEDTFARLCAAAGAGARLERGAAERGVAGRLREGSAERWVQRLLAAGVPAAAAPNDLRSVAADPRLEPLFEPLPEGGLAPASPWRFNAR